MHPERSAQKKFRTVQASTILACVAEILSCFPAMIKNVLKLALFKIFAVAQIVPNPAWLRRAPFAQMVKLKWS